MQGPCLAPALMDGTRGITSIAYDDNGSPAGIQFANGSATDTLTLVFKYFNKHHLGNIREVIGEDGTVEQVTATILSDSS